MKPHVYGVIGEDDSDVLSLRELIQRLRVQASKKPEKVPIRLRGYSGCGEMLRKLVRQLGDWVATGVTRVVVCYDADRENPAARMEILEQAVAQSGIGIPSCLLVPVQELEAWFLADHGKLQQIFQSLRKAKKWHKPIAAPEKVKDPKERLAKLSCPVGKRATLYHHPTHNEVMAQLVDLSLLRSKCPSFLPLDQFIGSE